MQSSYMSTVYKAAMTKRAYIDTSNQPNPADISRARLDDARRRQIELMDQRRYYKAMQDLGIKDPATVQNRLSWANTKKFLLHALLGGGLGAFTGATLGYQYGKHYNDSKKFDLGAKGGLGGGAAGFLVGSLIAAAQSVAGGLKGGLADLSTNELKAKLSDPTTDRSLYDLGYTSAQLGKYLENRISDGSQPAPQQIVF